MSEYYEKFLPFFGNNHHMMTPATKHRGGGVSFTRHLGKPLTEALWEDLTERFHCISMRIYRPNDMQWTIGFVGTGAFIHLDDEDLVREIQVDP